MTLQAQLARALLFQHSPKYKAIVNRAISFSQSNQLSEARKELAFLPTDSKLLEALMKKVAHKSVGTGIKRLAESKVTNKFEAAKIYSSTLTHLLIEAEQGNLEYIALVDSTIAKIKEALA